jgi:agmatine/peptidylarginine deiminase
VLLPIYEDEKDRYVYDLFCEIFPDREIIPINANILIRQHGSIHCISKEYFNEPEQIIIR